MSKAKPRAIGIVRVSQLGKRDRETFSSPKDQCDKMRALAEREGWDLTIPEPYEINVSGDWLLEDRPQLSRAVVAVQTGAAEVICAAHTERLWWNHEIRAQVLRLVQGSGGEVWSEDEGKLSNGTASEEFSGTVRTAADRFTRRQNIEKSKKGVQRAIDAGKVPWSQTTPGYLRDEDSKLTPDPVLAPVIVRAFELRAGVGLPRPTTIEKVREYLAENGVERSYHGVQHLLRDRIYLGEIRFGAREYVPNLDAHPGIVPPDLFEEVQALIEHRGRRAESPRLLSRTKVLRCGTCGTKMTAGTQRQNGRSYPFYRCPSKWTRGSAEYHPRATIGAELVEDAVVNAVKGWLVAAEGRASADEEAQAAVAEAERDRANYEAAMDALEDFTDAAAVKKLRELREKAEASTAKAERLGSRRVTVDLNAVDDWDQLSLDAQRELVKVAIDRVVIAPGGRGPERIRIYLSE